MSQYKLNLPRSDPPTFPPEQISWPVVQPSSIWCQIRLDEPHRYSRMWCECLPTQSDCIPCLAWSHNDRSEQINCLASSLSRSSCLPNDDSCLCSDQIYNDFVNSCVLRSCTVKEQLTTQRVTSLGCGVTYDDTSGSLLLLHYLCFASQTICFILRMVSRAARLAPWGLDDTTIVISWACSHLPRLHLFHPLNATADHSKLLTVGFLASGITGAVVQIASVGVAEEVLTIPTQRRNSVLESHTGLLNSGRSRPHSKSTSHSKFFTP